jgi:hypothetical protein
MWTQHGDVNVFINAIRKANADENIVFHTLNARQTSELENVLKSAPTSGMHSYRFWTSPQLDIYIFVNNSDRWLCYQNTSLDSIKCEKL